MMPVSTWSLASAECEDPYAVNGQQPWNAAAAAASDQGGTAARRALLHNPHHGLKEKMRALTLLYEQHKQQFSASQGACGKLLATNHPTINHNNQIEHKEEEDVTRAEERAHHDAANAVLEPPAMKLSLGGGVGVKPKAIGEVGVGNAEAGSRILVFVRLRPMSRKEKEAGSRNCVKIVNKKDIYLTEFASEIDYLWLKRVRGRHFFFDTSFPDSTTLDEVYSTTTSDLVEGVLQGRNGTMFCYGATGVGKTYTMLGTMEDPSVTVTVFCYGATGAGKTYTMLGTMENPGVMVLSMKDLFSKVRQRSHDDNHLIQLSYLEVYNETVRDLLSPGRPLLLRQDKQGTVAAGLTHYRAYSTDEVMNLLQQGNQNRTTEPTRANDTSSRSRAILQVVAEYRFNDGVLRHRCYGSWEGDSRFMGSCRWGFSYLLVYSS